MFKFAFTDLNQFMYMEGHGIYVWSVFSIVIISLVLAFIFYNKQLKKIKRKHSNE